MCGIIGIVSHRDDISGKLLDGISRLEYRGYDSSGIACIANNKIRCFKAQGGVDNLPITDVMNTCSNIGIAHTRWATHGPPIIKNAHPHVLDGIAIAHNGIVENFLELYNELVEEGESFSTDTDTEVLLKLLHRCIISESKPEDAIKSVISAIKGDFAFVVIFENYNRIFAAKRTLPIVIGYGENEMFVSSDSYAISQFTNKILYLEDDEIAAIGASDASILYEVQNTQRRLLMLRSNNEQEQHDSEVYEGCYFLKEMSEQPVVLQRIISEIPQEFLQLSDMKDSITGVDIVGCGSSYITGLISRFWLDRAGIRTRVESASEYIGRDIVYNNIGIFISQSGETADTLSALKLAKSRSQKTIAIVNNYNSSLCKEADIVINTRSGIEISVASTKTVLSQMMVMQCMSLYFEGLLNSKIEQLKCTGQIVDVVIKNVDISSIAHTVSKCRNLIYIGRGINYGIAREGALKMQELAYIQAAAFAAGELKHGPLALIDQDSVVIAIAPCDSGFLKICSSIQEVLARRGTVIVVTDQDGKGRLHEICNNIIVLNCKNESDFAFSAVAIMQKLAFSAAKLRGNNIDRPRNLAKSVTVS